MGEMDSSLYALNYAGLQALLESEGVKAVHARTLWKALYQDLVPPAEMKERDDFPTPLKHWCRSQEGRLNPVCSVQAEVASTDGLTRKVLLSLADGQTIETVLMGYPGRHTACVSTQAGCAMGCVFCATGQMGFSRHLTAAEIVGQIVHDQILLRRGSGGALRNVVLMGMGEPLHNYDAVMTALEIVTDTRGLNLGPSRITVSTVGHVPGILRMASENQPYHLAVSLHGATQEDRARLVPVARNWPLEALIGACHTFSQKTGRGVFIEWTLIAGKNDTLEQAEKLAACLAGLKSHVNLIPLNPTSGFAGAATGLATAGAFQRVLADAGIPSTVRQRRGIDVAAGCGQLRAACN